MQTVTDQQNIHAGAEERATRSVAWWIAGNYDGGEATCRQWEDMVGEEVAGSVSRNTLEFDETRRNAIYNLAERLKAWCEDERGDVHATPFDDMLGYMMACVDWEQLAEDAVDEELRQQD